MKDENTQKQQEDTFPEIDDITLEESSDDLAREDTEENGEVTLTSKITLLKQKVLLLENEKKQNLDGWLRAQADYKNLLKESEQTRKEGIMLGKKRLVESLLPVLDAYDQAMSNKVAWEAVSADWRIGIEYIFSQFYTTLSQEGIISFGTIGDEVDLRSYEAMTTEITADASMDGKVSRVLTRGYKMGNDIIRPAKVAVWHYQQS